MHFSTVSPEKLEYPSKIVENERQVGDGMEAIGASTAASNHNEQLQSQNQKAVVGSESLQSGTKKNVDTSTTKLVEEDTLKKNIHDD